MSEKVYVEPVDCSAAEPSRVWYLFHQLVISEHKGGKVRIVLDNATVSSGVSLNDLRLQGPDMMTVYWECY